MKPFNQFLTESKEIDNFLLLLLDPENAAAYSYQLDELAQQENSDMVLGLLISNAWEYFKDKRPDRSITEEEIKQLIRKLKGIYQ